MWEAHAVVGPGGRKDRCYTTADNCAASAGRGCRRRLWMPGPGVLVVGRPSLLIDGMRDASG